MEEVALAISPKTHAASSSHQELAGRAFLRNFHHNHTPSPLAGLCSAPLYAGIVCLTLSKSLSKSELPVHYFIGLEA
jgi:hypothetical protein